MLGESGLGQDRDHANLGSLGSCMLGNFKTKIIRRGWRVILEFELPPSPSSVCSLVCTWARSWDPNAVRGFVFFFLKMGQLEINTFQNWSQVWCIDCQTPFPPIWNYFGFNGPHFAGLADLYLHMFRWCESFVYFGFPASANRCFYLCN